MDLVAGILPQLRLKAGAGQLTDLRGLVMEGVSDLRPLTFDVIVRDVRGVDLVPGQETPVEVQVAELPRNADVKRIEATLHVGPESAPGPPETTNVTVTGGGGAQQFGVAVASSPLPRNVQVSLAGGEVFWTHTGTLPEGDHPLGDFADAANGYLDAARLPEGATTLSFLVRSDTPGRVEIAIRPGSLEYTMLQTQAWPNPVDESIAIDRTLDLDFGAIVRIPLDAPRPSGRQLPLATVRLDLSGAPGPERLLGDVPVHDGRQFATVGPDHAVAQKVTVASGGEGGLGFRPGGVVRVAGVAVAAVVDAEAELYLEIQPDAGGAPATGVPLGGVDFTLGRAVVNERGWLYAALSEAIEVPSDTPHWVLLRSIRGMAYVAIAPDSGGDPGWLLVNRGGQLWKPIVRDAVGALARIVYLPDPDTDSGPLALGFEGRPSLRPSVAGQVQRLTLNARGVTTPAVLVVTAHCRGQVTLANVVQEFGEEGGP